MVFDFFKKLLMARQLTFEEGQIKVAGETAIMVHGPALVKLSDMLIKSMGKRGIDYIYLSSKESGKILAQAFKKKYGLKGMELANLIKDLAEMSGWGKIEFIKFDFENKTVIGKIIDSPFAELTEFRNKKMCHIIRGFIAGSISIIFETDVDCIEVKCKADGSEFCEGVIKPKSKFLEKKLVKEQLPQKIS
jgi:predicted hydrocarbon binding protein